MSTVWDEWRNLTRFLESARVAFARERSLWQSLELADPESVTISTTTGVRRFQVSLSDHLASVDDEVTLYAAVLIHTYALAEDAGCRALGVDSRSAGGIENWGKGLLAARGRDWSGVLDGEAGAVEVAVVRNAFTHGAREIDAGAVARLSACGAPLRSVGDRVGLQYEELRVYRDRLRSLLRVGGVDLMSPVSTS
jgi:hypothetical protein